MLLRTKIGITQIKFLRNAIITGKETGKLITLSLQYSQREAGITQPILEFPGIHIPYLTPTWLTTLRQYMYNHNLTISITNTHTISLQGAWDQCIMNMDFLKNYSKQQQLQINRVRLHLQVTTLADMCDETGCCIQTDYLCGIRPRDFVSNSSWPRQPTVTKAQQRLWKRYVTAYFLRYDRKWINKLPDLSNRKKEHPANPLLPTQHPSLQSYLSSLPPWYKRLLHTYKQQVTDLTIWRHFRSKKKIIIVSDGGLARGIGTFGWKIVGSNNETLFAGAGPIDGPSEIGSSTRSELGGFAAPLLLVVSLARLWGLKHKCRYRWLVDSKAAISQVRITTRVSHQLRRAPDNSDYLMVIRALRRELGRPIENVWVKGHQDTDTSQL